MSSDSPVDVVDRQIAAYNDGDVDAFIAEFAAEAVVTGFADEEEPMAVGEAELRELYGQQFEAVSPGAEVLDRIALGEYVVDHERIEQDDGKEMEAIGVYRVVDGEISRLWLAHG